MKPIRAIRWMLLLTVALLGADLVGQQSDQDDAGKIPPPQTTYMGRTIAQTMHYEGAEWLIRAEREREENASMMIEQLRLRPGMVVCDLGCGNGFHTLMIAKRLGENGRVIAVDVQAQMLEMLRERMEQEGTENVIPILGSMHNPRLPHNSVDLILMVDVYHELSYPELLLTAMRDALKPDGVIVLVEFRAEDPLVPIKPLHKMSKLQIMKEIPANGFQLQREFDELPWQHMMFFSKAEAPHEEDSAPRR